MNLNLVNLYLKYNVVSLRNFIFLKFFYMSNQLLNYDHFFNFSIIPSLVFKKTNF